MEQPRAPTTHAPLHQALALYQQGRLRQALDLAEQALARQPGQARLLNLAGGAAFGLGALDAAERHWRAAVAAQPDLAAAHNNLGSLLQTRGCWHEAEAALRRALALHPRYAEAHCNLGNLLLERGRLGEAEAAFRQALAARPDYAEALKNLAMVLTELGRLEEALAACGRAAALRPDHPETLARLLHCARQACAWHDLARREAQVRAYVRAGAAGISPFGFLALAAPPAEQLACARQWAASLARPAAAATNAPARPDRRIRLGYLSADFHAHATAYLMAELVERHDRANFAVIGYSCGPDDASPMRARLARAFDRFVDLRALAHTEAAARIRADEVDILIDLKGYTQGARPLIPAQRPAPVQVSFLGYPGTLGAPFIDYLIADAFVAPAEHQSCYSEALVHLPDCYQPNDTQRPIAARTPTRAECGLPEAGFVFCCFNNSYKITPEFFDIWMRLLAQTSGSVLWLLAANPLARANLGREAQARGIDPARLVFAPRLPLAEHLARQRLADLFLDTLPVNAHTTASDALWAGLPVLTCVGATFIGRVAGSLLKAVGLPELVTDTPAAYADLALRLTREPDLLAALRARLAASRASAPLFDSGRYTRHLESAYRQMWQRHCAGQPPAAFAVAGADGDAPSPLLEQAADHYRQGRFQAALDLAEQTLTSQPAQHELLNVAGAAAHALGLLEAAEHYWRRAIAVRPDCAGAHNNLSILLRWRNRLDEAEAACRRALEADPLLVEAHYNLGNLLRTLGRADEAEAAYRRAMALQPHYVGAHYNLGNLLQARNRPDEAEAAYRRTLELNPGHVKAHNNLGTLLQERGRTDEAEAAYRRALELNPHYAQAHNNLGTLFQGSGRLEEALAAYRRALAAEPDYPEAASQLLHLCQHACDWGELAARTAQVRALVRARAGGIAPFNLLALGASAAEQADWARHWAATLPAVDAAAVPAHTRDRRPGRIRLGYLSADLHRHATAYLVAELFEHHDRGAFEVIAYSYGPDDGSDLRARLVRAFDRFVDIRALSHAQAAARIRADQVDILVDLKGYTQDARPAILAYRPAPVQVNWLGYPGTMGAPFMDYLIADAFVAPFTQQAFYSEALVHLPDCYQPNDSRRAIAAHTPSRAECGLPETGFVFCCFNNSYKFTPEFFDIWMRLLAQTPGSVLWLLETNPLARANLGRAAQARGIDPARLVFAPRAPLPEHLARHRLADLFLDTLPVNAHTTASDALWAGLPLLTCVGDSFIGRVAGSLLRTVGLPELITDSPAAYEALALRLTREPALLAALRERLAANRLSTPLFDSERFTRHLEAAYRILWERWSTGQAPTPFAVAGGSPRT